MCVLLLRMCTRTVATSVALTLKPALSERVNWRTEPRRACVIFFQITVVVESVLYIKKKKNPDGAIYYYYYFLFIVKRKKRDIFKIQIQLLPILSYYINYDVYDKCNVHFDVHCCIQRVPIVSAVSYLPNNVINSTRLICNENS